MTDQEMTNDELPAKQDSVEPPLPETQQSVVATEPTFEELDVTPEDGPERNLSMLYDLAMPVAIELGRTKMTIQEILNLGRGSVIQLERSAGEPIDVLVANRKVAEGEVVVIGEHFGIRITRIVRRVAQDSGALA